MTLSERTYGQYCPIAAGLDLVGDRWTLLICRELAQGDRRYTDLCSALDGIAPNLLSDRLRMLQDAGLVTTAELPPPAARSVYRLTDDGRDVIPVLRAMARFGVRYLDGEPDEEMSAARGRERAAASLAAPDRCRACACASRSARVESTSARTRRRHARSNAAEGDADVVDHDRLRGRSCAHGRASRSMRRSAAPAPAKKQLLEVFALTPS